MIALHAAQTWGVVVVVGGVVYLAVARFIGRFLSPTRFDHMPREWVERQRRNRAS